MILDWYNEMIFLDASLIQESLLLSSEEFLNSFPDYLNADSHHDREMEYFVYRKVEKFSYIPSIFVNYFAVLTTEVLCYRVTSGLHALTLYPMNIGGFVKL